MKDIIKIGIIIDGEDVPLWIYRVIEKISCSEFAEIKLIIYNNNKEKGHNNSKYSFIYKLHKKLDQLIFSSRVDYDKIVEVSNIIQGILCVSVNSKHNNQYNKTENTFHDISIHDLDIILNFSSFSFNESSLKLAKYGIWHYGIVNRNITGDFTSGYWELVKKIPVIEAVLLSSNSSFKKEIVIHRSWFPTNFNSLQINLDHAYGLCSIIIPRLIKGFYLYGFESFKDLTLKYEKSDEETNNRIFFPPSNRQALINILVILFRYFFYRLEYHDKWKWFLMYKFNQNPFPDASSNYKTLVPPKDRFWADPFVICRNSKIFIFIEEVIYRIKKGHITLLELDKEGKLLQTEKILEKPYHMSYPFIFEYDNSFYMIPETSENKTIELYKCEEFPVKWSFVRNLKVNIIAKDTTIFFYKNKWWLFTAINESHNFSDYAELFLFYSNDFYTTDWIPHPNNPIVTDIRNARPAGRVFMYDNKIYRPSQDCSVRYGRALNINQIITLSETSYKEVLISRNEAIWEAKLKGTHTLNFDENFSIIDVYKY